VDITIEAGGMSGTIVSNDISEDSDVSLLAVNDEDDETMDDASDVDANLRITDATVLSVSNPVMELGPEAACHVSETSGSLPLAAGLSTDTSGNATGTQDAVAVSRTDSSCTRHQRRSHHRHRRSVMQSYLVGSG